MTLNFELKPNKDFKQHFKHNYTNNQKKYCNTSTLRLEANNTRFKRLMIAFLKYYFS